MAVDHRLQRARAELLGEILERERVVAAAVLFAEPAREVEDVVRGIPVLRDLEARRAAELAVPHREALLEELHLVAGVVHVVLARYVGALEREHVREHVPERAATRVRDRHRAGRVRRHELDLDLLAGQGLAPAEPLPRRDDHVDLPREPRLGQAQVHETGLRDLDGRDRVADGDALLHGLGDLEWRPPELARQLHRDVRRVIAVRGVLRVLDLHRDAARGLVPAELVRGAEHRCRDDALDDLCRGRVRHQAAECGAASAIASPRGSWPRNSTSWSKAATRYAAASMTRFAV